MADRCLITGCAGFLGSHLADLLVELGMDVYGAVYPEDTRNIDHLRGRMTIASCDLRDRAAVNRMVSESEPDFVFHLGAQSFVTVSWVEPDQTYASNLTGTFNLLEALRESGRKPVIEVISSSAVYGTTEQDELPIKETKEFRPTSHYGVSKAATDSLGYLYWKVFGMPVIRVRPFNTTGPRKTGDACSDFLRGIAAVEKGLAPYLGVGNLTARRDFTDGRDASKALWILAQRGIPGDVYNMCSGEGQSLEFVLETALSLAKRPIDVRPDDSKFRPIDDPVYVGDASKLRALGWSPEIPLRATLADSLDHWRRTP